MALCVHLDLAVPEALHANVSFEMFLHVQLHVTLFLGIPLRFYVYLDFWCEIVPLLHKTVIKKMIVLFLVLNLHPFMLK